MKKLLKVLAVLIALAFVGGTQLAHAQVYVRGQNITTGPFSENENEWEIDQDFNLDIDNDAYLENDWDFVVNTGDEHIYDNTCVGDVQTGDISGNIRVNNELNSENMNLDLMSLGDMGNIDVKFANDYTGPHSENENEAEIRSEVDVDIRNTAHIDNDLDLRANTGENHIGSNTADGDIQTGDIRFDAEVNNSVNANAGSLDLGNIGSMDVNSRFQNDVTGPESENSNEMEIRNDVDVDINNDAHINNDANITANTGDNCIDHNTVVGDIETGSIDINFETTNTAN